MRLTSTDYRFLGASFFRDLYNRNTEYIMGETYSKVPNVDRLSENLRLTVSESYQMRLTKQCRYAKFASSPGYT